MADERPMQERVVRALKEGPASGQLELGRRVLGQQYTIDQWEDFVTALTDGDREWLESSRCNSHHEEGRRAVALIDKLAEALAAAQETIRFADEQRRAAEARVRELEADEHSLSERGNRLAQQLAAAHALLKYIATDAPDTAIGERTMMRIRSHLSAQPAEPTDHDRAVLEAADGAVIEWVQAGTRTPRLSDGSSQIMAESVLARREAKR